MVKKVMVQAIAVCTNGYTWRGTKTDISVTSKMDIADLYRHFQEYIKENGNGAKLKEFHLIFDEGV